jgi:hypothetical protein
VPVPAAWAGSLSSGIWTLLVAVGTLITILTPLVTLVSIIVADNTVLPATILSIYVCLLITGLLVFSLRMEEKYRRQALYSRALLPAQEAFSRLAEASWTIVEGDGSQESFIHNLENSLQRLANAFSIITDSSCRVSVKVVSAGTEDMPVRDLQVVTLCRSTTQPERSFPEPDRIGGNTDYLKIFVENKSYYFSNNLPAELSRGYKNSHWDERTIQDGKFEYTATIVWPIGRTKPSDGVSPPRREIIGFLCVDTLTVGVFREPLDIPLGAAFAQGLHLALHRFRAGQSSSQEASAAVPTPRPPAGESPAEEVSL